MPKLVCPNLDGVGLAYARDGYAIVRRVINDHLVASVSRHMDWLINCHLELQLEWLGYWLDTADPFWMWSVSNDVLSTLPQPW